MAQILLTGSGTPDKKGPLIVRRNTNVLSCFCSCRLMGLSQSSVLAFVIDTTGSMSDDITEAKRVSFDIIDRKRGTPQEPSAYILVPFNDPGG